MPSSTLCRTIHQYNEDPVTPEDMRKLKEIASDYSKVKNYVYQRYGGIKSLSKIYPGYTVQNEMTDSGLRLQLNMPSVYFYLAVFDALGDIKNQWTQTRERVQKRIRQHETFSEEEKHYLRFVIKVNNCLEAILNYHQIQLPPEIERQYESLSKELDTEKLNHYLRRQVRKHLRKLHTDCSDGFSVTERAYRYGDHGIYISIKEKRKRIFIRLTDNHRYKRQLYIKLYPEQSRIELQVPVNVPVKKHPDYLNEVGLAVGFYTMFTTDEGHEYGAQYGEIHQDLMNWVWLNKYRYIREKANNPGRQKYRRIKGKLDARLHTYINQEINRMLRTEKPSVLYLPALQRSSPAGASRKINGSISMWQKGYMKRRLKQKCREQSIEIVEVLGKGISTECSCCGATGTKQDGVFVCTSCGLLLEEKKNTARNVKKRGSQRKFCFESDLLQSENPAGRIL